MCGIAGLIAKDVTRPQLEQANRLLHHRGPDSEGYFVSEGIGLATRRLSIIDLAGGQQPLSNEDGSIWITYNGEVVNAPLLRRELETIGHCFQTQSDTEVVVHAYEEWGTEAFARLRGMFAFGLWDGRSRQLILVRDRFGMKPLYYSQLGSQFAFASEIGPLFTLLPTLARRANLPALQNLFVNGFMPTPLTAFHNVHKLPAAHFMVVSATEIKIQPYWQLAFPRSDHYLEMGLETAVDQFMSHLREAVAAWRLSDVPVGALLSGGIDSSTLAALLAELTGNIHTFHISFAADAYDESAYAQQVAQQLGSHHHTISFTQADFDCLPLAVRHLEEPQCSTTSLPIYKLYQACREAGFKVILTGEGADELLGGYHWYDGDRRIRPLLNLPRFVRSQLARFPLNVSTAGRRVLSQGTPDPIGRFYLWQQVAPLALVQNLFQWSNDQVEYFSLYPATGELNGRHPLNQFLYLESQTRLVDFINLEVDRMSMVHSIEARPPFLDHILWEFVAQLPPEFKLNREMNKRLLRLGTRGVLPTAVVQRPKQGLASPHAAWWRNAHLPNWAEACLHPTALAETGYFKPKAVAHLRAEHKNGKVDNGRILTGILTTQLWHQEMEIGR
ncbi:MAG: asparagine synthase (glutamine-hydrolyzing) [Ardenticatenaceae bacterium]|nr:asparagine synthase (glutamine-hydrolyzing) [Ardenticatenaceae bacterium]